MAKVLIFLLMISQIAFSKSFKPDKEYKMSGRIKKGDFIIREGTNSELKIKIKEIESKFNYEGLTVKAQLKFTKKCKYECEAKLKVLEVIPLLIKE